MKNTKKIKKNKKKEKEKNKKNVEAKGRWLLMISRSGSNSIGGTLVPLPPWSKNVAGNRTNIEQKYGTDVLRNEKEVKCNYCSKIFNGGIFRFKHDCEIWCWP